MIHHTHKQYKESLSFSERLALRVTESIGTMICTYIFAFLAAMSLPATLALMGVWPHHILPAWATSQSFIWLITWICQNFLQLVLLPLLMVGQNLQGRHAAIEAENDYQTNIQAKKDIESLMKRLGRIENEKINKILTILKNE